MIDISIRNQKTGELSFDNKNKTAVFNYTHKNDSQPISLIMPYKSASYVWKNKLHPIFDMYLPEGYLFELFKNLLAKEHGYLDDFLVFSYLCNNIQGRLEFKSELGTKNESKIDIESILQNDTPDTFTKLVHTFLNKNAISGVQPKTLALLQNKESLHCEEYIVKTWGDEYPQLALNEYLSLKALEKAGIPIPDIQLSQNNRFLLVKKFTQDTQTGEMLGFEEVLGLLGKNKEEKYSGSYEQVAKVVYSLVSDKPTAMATLFKTIVMSYLLKNGDAHLKNFGVLYNNDFSEIRFAPAYDIVNTHVYIHQDKPALTLFGKKLWFGRKELIKFGVQHCYLSQSTSTELYDCCIQAVQESIDDIQTACDVHPEFKQIGQRMIDCCQHSLKQETHKELDHAIIRNWHTN